MTDSAAALPYPDDDPETIRGFKRRLGALAESITGDAETVRGGRASLTARWEGAAGPTAVAEVDAIDTFADRCAGACSDAEAPLEDYAAALDEARDAIDGLRARYDRAQEDYQQALDSLEGSDMPEDTRRTARDDAGATRGSTLSAIQADYDEVIDGLNRTANTGGAALTEIAGRISDNPTSLNGSLARARALAVLPLARTATELANRHGIDAEIAALYLLVKAGHPVRGDLAAVVLLVEFGRFDTAAEGGDPDGRVSLKDLRAMVADGSLPAYMRNAARYLLDNPTLRGLIDIANEANGMQRPDHMITAAGITTFLTTNRHLRTLYPHFGRLAGRTTGDGNGVLGPADLRAAAADPTLPAHLREAARYLLDNPAALRSVTQRWGDLGADQVTSYDLIKRLVDGQAYVHDPVAAMNFTVTLPVPRGGRPGLPIGLGSEDGTKALAVAGLIGANGDLTDSQAVIAHLPETRSAVRNELFTAYYDMLSKRVDGVFTRAAGSGGLGTPGHPGVSWLAFGPWASNGIHDTINGTQLPFVPMSIRQAAADGNQWIFNDVTAPFARFVEMYESTGGDPSTADLQRFFDRFEPGQAELRRGFQAYVAATEETDPARRQQLMFQGNTLAAIHEQAGAEPYLDRVAMGPDAVPTEFIGLDVGGRRINVSEDLPRVANGANLVDDAPILGFDPMALTHGELSGGDVRFSGSGARGGDAVVLPEIGGWSDSGLKLTPREWYDEQGSVQVPADTGSRYPGSRTVHPDPDAGLAGTRAQSWPDYEDRMWNIYRLFEQYHTSPELLETGSVHDQLQIGGWLPDDLPLGLEQR